MDADKNQTVCSALIRVHLRLLEFRQVVKRDEGIKP
jgi:hypothetical protein